MWYSWITTIFRSISEQGNSCEVPTEWTQWEQFINIPASKTVQNKTFTYSNTTENYKY